MQTNLKLNQNGRSMVEMLGVLAIIGVLSVAGIQGYTVAMNKHRANEILNDASIRAMMVSAKLHFDGNADVSNALAEFGNERIAGASFTKVDKGTGTFTLTLSDVLPDVCDQIRNIVGEHGNVAINDDCTNFIYNNDLSAGVTPVPAGKPCTGEQPAGMTCVNGLYLCSSNGQAQCNGVCCAKGEICTAEGAGEGYAVCYKPSGVCATNAECTTPGTFCYFDGYDTASTAGTTCSVPKNGQCVLVSEYMGGVAASGAFAGWTYGNPDKAMNWWSANNWCQAVLGKSGNMHLVTKDEVNAAVQEFTGATATNTSRKEALIAMFGAAKTMWTSTTYGSTSCFAYRVGLTGLMNNLARNGNGGRPVCRE